MDPILSKFILQSYFSGVPSSGICQTIHHMFMIQSCPDLMFDELIALPLFLNLQPCL
jgi:hypothetical protein